MKGCKRYVVYGDTMKPSNEGIWHTFISKHKITHTH